MLPEKIGRNNFFARKLVFFFKSLCFQQTPRCYGNDLITCTMTAIIPWGAWKNVTRGLLYSVRRKEISQICFSSGKQLFLRNCFHPTRKSLRKDLVTCRKTVTKPLLNTYKRFTEVFILDKTRKNQPKQFFGWKKSLFSKKCVSKNLLSVTERMLQLAQGFF